MAPWWRSRRGARGGGRRGARRGGRLRPWPARGYLRRPRAMSGRVPRPRGSASPGTTGPGRRQFALAGSTTKEQSREETRMHEPLRHPSGLARRADGRTALLVADRAGRGLRPDCGAGRGSAGRAAGRRRRRRRRRKEGGRRRVTARSWRAGGAHVRVVHREALAARERAGDCPAGRRGGAERQAPGLRRAERAAGRGRAHADEPAVLPVEPVPGGCRGQEDRRRPRRRRGRAPAVQHPAGHPRPRGVPGRAHRRARGGATRGSASSSA